MSKDFRPLLAGKAPADLSTLKYPVLLSPKLDGIRCIIRNGVATSRTGKPIPNPVIQAFFADGRFDGLDGELIVGEHDESVFKRSTSFVMSKTVKYPEQDEPGYDSTLRSWNWYFAVFDTTNVEAPFSDRIRVAAGHVKWNESNRVRLVPHVIANSEEEVTNYERDTLAAGYEGVMCRDPSGAYKQGRSTTREGILLKIKRFNDAEATVVGFEERYHNRNEAHKNEVGATERSTCKDGLVPAGDLGSLRVVGPNGVEFNVGSGFTQAEREDLWVRRESLIGSLIKYQFFELTESGAPRFPTFKGFRSEDDI